MSVAPCNAEATRAAFPGAGVVAMPATKPKRAPSQGSKHERDAKDKGLGQRRVPNDMCSGVHAETNKNPAVRGQGEVDFIAACVIAAKFYADNIGAPPEQTKDLIKRIADIDIAMRLQPVPKRMTATKRRIALDIVATDTHCGWLGPV